MQRGKQKAVLTRTEQNARELCTRIFRESLYSPEFIELHMESTTPLLVPLLQRLEREILEHLADELLKRASSCDLDRRMFHLPASEEKLKGIFTQLTEQWRDSD